jgi:hypothetical protein
MKGTSAELQEISLAGLISDPYILAKCSVEITEAYFSKQSYKIIYRCIKNFYNKYMSIPTVKELVVLIKDTMSSYEQKYIDETVSDAEKICSMKISSSDFVYEKIIEFIRRQKIESCLGKTIEFIESSNEIDLDKIAVELKDSINLNFTKSPIYNLSDITKIKEVREESLGSADQSLIIKCFLEPVNRCMQYGGLIPGTVNMLVAPPGCFTGDTRVMTLDGISHTLQELYDSKQKLGLYGADSNGNLSTGLADSVYLSKFTDSLIEVTIDNKYVVRCTSDHPFMMRDGTYKNAETLKEFDELMPIRRIIGNVNHSKDSGEYEELIDCNGGTCLTHRLVAESLVERPEGFSVVHHKDRNRFNNYPDNLMWFKNQHEHLKYHFHNGDYSTFVENGKATRITSEIVSDRNRKNWKDQDYRSKMSEIISENSKKSAMVMEYNHEPAFQRKTRQGKVLSFMNKLLISGYDLSDVSKYGEIVDSYMKKNQSCKRCIRMRGIAEAFDLDISSLASNWDYIIQRALCYNHKVTSVKRINLEDKVPVYGIVEARPNHNYAIALSDEEGIIVSNSGKTTWLINQGISTAEQGFNVLHIFLGDMSRYDGLLRYASCLSGVPTAKLVKLDVDGLESFIKKINMSGFLSRVSIGAYAAGELTASKLIEEILTAQKLLRTHFNLVIIDYDENLSKETDSMYESGGEIYNKIGLFAVLNKSVVFIAAQPKPEFWDKEVIPLKGAAESSKKQKIIDLMMTIGKPRRGSSVGTLFIAKNRRGIDQKIVRLQMSGDNARVKAITGEEYAKLRTVVQEDDLSNE